MAFFFGLPTIDKKKVVRKNIYNTENDNFGGGRGVGEGGELERVLFIWLSFIYAAQPENNRNAD